MEFQIFSEPKKIYESMLNDISKAKKSIYLETYIYGDDEIGKKFRDCLIQKTLEGVKVFVLIDSWGSNVDKNFFNPLTDEGGQVKFFKEFQWVFRVFSKNHERNHRKLLIVDNNIVYVGSININSECLRWRELALRIKGPIAKHFSSAFHLIWNSTGKLSKKKVKTLFHRSFEIIQDLPGDLASLTRNKYLKLIKHAKKEILIETPYFIPPFRIRRALAQAVKRGVEVKILLPHVSDVRIVDILRNRYLGYLFRKGIKIFYYKPQVLHSKLLLVDNRLFLLGSSNLDYQSFLHLHEINLFGSDLKIASKLKEFYLSGLRRSEKFSYKQWKSRSSFGKIAEIFLRHIERYL